MAHRLQTKCLFKSKKWALNHPWRPRGSQSGWEKRRNESFQARAEEPLGMDSLKQILAPDWAQKMLCIIVPNRRTASPEFFLWVRTWWLLTCLAHAPKKCTQSGNFQFKLKTLFQKYKLELTTGIQACIGHVLECVNIRQFLKDTTTADNHENVAWKREFTFFQFLSWLFQLAYFVKCKRTLLELNFYQPYPSS